MPDLGPGGEPDSVSPVGMLLEEPAVGCGDAIDFIRQLLKLPALGAGEFNRAAHAGTRSMSWMRLPPNTGWGRYLPLTKTHG